ncbi:hypothetical protein L1765_00610 [Microaerobacter geothermalis]|uniref:hypothetical protein n=1 Tax=Microaerobacter geothermalis TaxID=674972 RepID=UPI001F243B95|nr:hypothetical protein [Microaerobacter geothermalis]MCF6092493.1 hypothetical protein [Microaerobacter geothermalis]
MKHWLKWVVGLTGIAMFLGFLGWMKQDQTTPGSEQLVKVPKGEWKQDSIDPTIWEWQRTRESKVFNQTSDRGEIFAQWDWEEPTEIKEKYSRVTRTRGS